MLYCTLGMPAVFIIARDWSLRAMVRAELLERGIAVVAMKDGAEAGARIAAGEVPTVVLLEAEANNEPGLDALAGRVPFVVVASGTDSDAWPAAAACVLRRPVRIAEIVTAVLVLLRGRAV